MMKICKSSVSLAVLIAVLLGQFVRTTPAAAVETAKTPASRVVIVVVDKITWDDVLKNDLPGMKKLAARGVVGLMTTNPAAGRPRLPENTYTTVGAGAKASGGSAGGWGYNADEKYENDTAGEAFHRYTGIRPGQSRIVQLGLPLMEKDSANLKYTFSIGAIGTILHENGIKTAVIGNTDLPAVVTPTEQLDRDAVNIAMDRLGTVDLGDVSARTYKFDARSLSGVRTDYEYLLQDFDKISRQAGLIVIETGDTSRLAGFVGVSTPEIWQQQKLKALKDADNFISRLVAKLDLHRDMIMIISPDPPTEAMEHGMFLTPFIMAGAGVGQGVAWSATVKRNGLVANTDIASTVVGHFGLPPEIRNQAGKKDIILAGQVIKSRKSADPFYDITRLDEETTFLYNARYPLVKGYTNLVLISVIAGVLALLLKKPVGQALGKRLMPLYVILTAVPGVLLWVGVLPHPSITFSAIEVTCLAVIISLIAMAVARGKMLFPFIVITGITTLVIIIDIYIGAPLAKTSPLSYDAMTGARFYGIGNEYMGVLIGCAIIFTGLVMDTLKTDANYVKGLAIAAFILIIYTIAAPNLGTNVGGMIASVAGLGATGLLMFGRPINRRTVFALTGLIALVLAGLMAYDLTRAVEAQSHIGRTVSLIRENGISEAANIISRKWDINFKLIKYSTWSWLYFASLLSVPLLNRRYPAAALKFKTEYPWFNKFYGAVACGSIFALIFNDSGIVSAATMIIYAIMPYLTGLFSFKDEKGEF